MIKREKYIAPIRDFYNSDLIKVITGIRRCGKSVILNQIEDEIRQHSDKVISLNFEDRVVRRKIHNGDELIDYIDANKDNQLWYIFLDEVQNLPDWNEACKTLRLHGCSLFITGSNSQLLSREFTKELSGRYVSFRIHPFVYRELVEYATQLNKEITITDYLIWGGFPGRLSLPSEEAMRNYLLDLDETIVINDIINRYKIRKTDEFQRFVNYILISNAREFSFNSIAGYMASHGTKTSKTTIKKWMDYLEEAYVIQRIKPYSTKAKRELDYSFKLYNEDVAMNSIRVSGNRYDFSHNLENIVLNELRYKGYEVSVFQNNGREIDFYAQKASKAYYIQVALSVQEEKAYEREFSAFSKLDQSNRKILITNDEIDYSTSTVDHLKLRDFLVKEEL